MKVIFLIFFTFFASLGCAEELIEKANQDYLLGVKAESIYEKNRAFNSALVTLKEIEKGVAAATGNIGKLNAKIGDVYFQLEEYPSAILYYFRAQKELSQDPALRHNLSLAQSKMGISAPPASLFSVFIPTLSVLVNLLCIAIITSFLLISFIIWQPNRVIKRGVVISSFATVVLLTMVVVHYYFSPMEGVLLKPSWVQSLPEEQSTIVNSIPLVPGTKVKVIGLAEEGRWLKIQTSEGLIGFMHYSVLSVI